MYLFFCWNINILQILSTFKERNTRIFTGYSFCFRNLCFLVCRLLLFNVIWPFRLSRCGKNARTNAQSLQWCKTLRRVKASRFDCRAYKQNSIQQRNIDTVEKPYLLFCEYKIIKNSPYNINNVLCLFTRGKIIFYKIYFFYQSSVS